MKTFHIFGLRRVGNHAIIEWIAKHFDHVIHYNDCWGWPDTTSFWVQKEYGDRTKPVDLKIYSYEDFEPSQEELDHPGTILLLRDWYNMAASRHVSKRGFGSTSRQRHHATRNRDTAEVWLKYAELYQGYSDKFILFNKWTLEEDYRIDISERFNLGGVVEYKSTLPESKIGAGSSFGDTEIDPQRVNNRFRQLSESDPAAYQKITSNLEINKYCKDIFNIEV